MPTEWVEKELLFAGATETRLWWLATGDDGKTYQVEVTGISFPGMPVWQIEQQFANSVAKVSVPCGAATHPKDYPRVKVIETGDKDWYESGIHIVHVESKAAQRLSGAKEEAIAHGFDTVYVHHIGKEKNQMTKRR